jgi:tetratricopeptide (TPR) repeat protein
LNSACGSGRRRVASLLVALVIAGSGGFSEEAPDRDPPVIESPMTVIAARDSALLISQERGGEIAGALTWTVSEAADRDGRVPLHFVVDVEGESLLVGQPPGPTTVEIIGYLLNKDAELISHVASEVTIADTDDRVRIATTGLSHLGELMVEQGRYSLRVLVRNRTTGRYCLRRCELMIDLDAEGSPTLLPPIVRDRSDRWFRTVQPGMTTGDAQGARSGPRWWPSARGAWRSGEPLDLFVAGSVLSDGHSVTARILDPTGRVILEPRLSMGDVAVSVDGMAVVEARVAPSELPPGRYRLVIGVDRSSESPMIGRWLSVWIHDRREATAWTDLGEMVAETLVAAKPALPVAVDPSQSVEGEVPAPPKTTVVPAETYSRPPQLAIQLPGVDARGVALMLSGHSGGAVDGALTWTVGEPDGERTDVALRFIVEVDGATLLANSPESPVPVEVAAYLLDANDVLIAHVASGVVLDTNDELSGVLGSGLKHVGGLDAPAARCSLRVLVRNRVSGDYYLERRDLELGGPDGPMLVPPIVPEPTDRWFKTIQPGLSTSVTADGAAGGDAWPSARPAWRADQALAVAAAGPAVVHGRPIAVRLEDRSGNAVLEPGLRLGSRAVDPAAGWTAGEVDAPDLPSGEYRLVMFIDDDADGRSTERPLSVIIHDRPDELAWTDLDEAVDSDPNRLDAEDPPSQAEIEHHSMRAAYRAGLLAWADGDRVASRRLLSELERPTAARGTMRAWRALVAAEGSVLSDLASERPAVLMGAVLIHRDMFHWYHARTEGALASHSWESAALLALEAEDLVGSAPPAGFTEAVLLDLADALVRSRHLDDGRQLLEAAERVAADSSRSLLALGALAEKSGRPEDAIRPLKRLVRLEPGHFEARLRLAVCHARNDDEREAEELLRGLLGPAVSPWIRVLAYQELGRLLIADDRLDDAIEVLAAGTSAIPDNQRLQILRAHALDRAGRPEEAALVIANIGSGSARLDESPRYRYAQWPTIDRDQFRVPLAEAEFAARSALRGVTP